EITLHSAVATAEITLHSAVAAAEITLHSVATAEITLHSAVATAEITLHSAVAAAEITLHSAVVEPTTKDVVLEERRDMLIKFQRLEEAIVEDMPRDLEGPTDDLVEDQPADAEPKEGAQRGRGGAGGGKGRDAIKSEPEEVHVEDVTMASDGQEPEPAAGAPSPAAPVAAPAVPPAGTGCGEHYPAVAESRSARWPALRAAIVEGAKVRGLSGTGTTEEERARFQQEAQGVPCVGYLDDFFMVARTAAEAQEMMDLLIEFVTMLGFKAVGVDAGGTDRQPDRDDWQFSPVLFAEMDEEFGPFTLDACVASSRANAFCVRSWSAEDDARKQRFDGLNAWANLPFSVMYEILLNFLKCKRKQQMSTGGCFVVPVWEGDEAYELVSGMREVFRPELLEELAVAVERYQDGAYAESTQRSYDTGVKAFLTFCEEAPLFQVEGRGKRGALVPMAHAALVAGLKSLAVQVGLDPAR
ncbi:hypothetical protein CYMTET_3825, partial [Cymbomonas tetramitiformis]